jgi:hypothetical protein
VVNDWRLAVFGFRIGEQLQQPIVLNHISRRVTLGLGDQPSIVREVFPVYVSLHCDLHGYMGNKYMGDRRLRLFGRAVEQKLYHIAHYARHRADASPMQRVEKPEPYNKHWRYLCVVAGARASTAGGKIMNRKGVEFSVMLLEPGLWRWQFQIDETVRTGTTKTNLKGMAARRAELQIDRELRMPRSLARY